MIDFFVVAACYLIGSIPVSYLVARYWKGIDIRRCGSGNVGMTNVWRNAVQANDEAEAVLVEMNDDFPTDQRVHDALIEIYLEEARYPELRDVLEKKRDVMAVDLSAGGTSAPLMADIESQLGMLTYGTGDDLAAAAGAAIDRYEAALSFDPTHAIPVVRLEELLAAPAERQRLTAEAQRVAQERAAEQAAQERAKEQEVAAKAPKHVALSNEGPVKRGRSGPDFSM